MSRAMLRNLLSSAGDRDGESDIAYDGPLSASEIRSTFIEAIEASDTAPVVGIVAWSLVNLAHKDPREYSDRLQTLAALVRPIELDNPLDDIGAIDAEREAIQAAIGDLRDRLDALDAEREAARRVEVAGDG